MATSLEDLRPTCAALMASGFSLGDRLKAILQVAFELLEASSIVAYKYERMTDRLEIFAMPGVGEREVMRGPTPEAIFAWEVATADKRPQSVWLEDNKAYEEYLSRISPTWPVFSVKTEAEGFRDRELRKHRDRLRSQGEVVGTDDDLAVAKLCLYKGVGQTSDRVGQLFFNFYKKDRSIPVFTDELKSAIEYVAMLVREVLVQQLYHGGQEGKGEDVGGPASLRLLQMVDERILAAKAVKNKLRDYDGCDLARDQVLPRDLRNRLRMRVCNRLVVLENLASSESSRDKGMACRRESLQQLLPLLKDIDEPTAPSAQPEQPLHMHGDEVRRELNELIHEDLEYDLWGKVCRAAISIVETYGGQADVILVLGDRLVRRLVPSGNRETDVGTFMLDLKSISAFCIDKRKVFVCNNVREKGSPSFQTMFEREPLVDQHRSLMIVPVLVEGEARAVIRLMSNDGDCFLDTHALAVQDLAFAAGYALARLDAFQRHERISAGLAFFAEGQAVADAPALPDLLREAGRVLGANLAICWPVDHSLDDVRPSEIRKGRDPVPFGEGHLIHVSGTKQKPEMLHPNDTPYLVRPKGLTNYILRRAEECDSQLLFCLHDLREVVKPISDPGEVLKAASPQYVLQVFADHKLDWLHSAQQTTDGSYYKSDFTSEDKLPGHSSKITINSCTPKFPHSQIGFAVKERGSPKVHAVVWFCCDTIHLLGWWERHFLQGLSNYLAQLFKADGLRLAIKSFRHMLYNRAKDTEIALRNSIEGTAGSRMDGIKPPDPLQTAASKAADLLYMVAQKCVEVKSLLNPPSEQSVFDHEELGSTLHRAWAISTGLCTDETHYSTEQVSQNGVIERAPEFTIYYTDGAIPSMRVTEAIYTGAVNILQNMIKHGGPPYAVWCSIQSGNLCLICGDAGRASSDRTQGVDESPAEGGTGLKLSKQILENAQGGIRKMRCDEVRRQEGVPKEMAEKCSTFFEVRVPLVLGETDGNRSRGV